jgi:hypothetical protein
MADRRQVALPSQAGSDVSENGNRTCDGFDSTSLGIRIFEVQKMS